MATVTTTVSTWAPLRQSVFRALWLASAFSSIGTWMHDVAAVWLMTSLAPDSPLLVALMQAASSLPFFLLALPAGAIADVIDRRKMLLVTQMWMLLVVITLGICTLMGWINPWILLGLTFALSLGTSMNLPVWQAVTPELVTKEELPAAATLSGIVINLARAIGPAIAGMIIAIAGGNPGPVFLLNACSFCGVLTVLYRWRRQPIQTNMPAERFWGAMQAGVRYVRFAPLFQNVLVRSAGYIFFASALFALLPLLGRRELGLDALGYGIILGFWGLGGLAGAFLLPKIRARTTSDRIVLGASCLFATTMLLLAQIRIYPILCLTMLLVGISSLSVMVTLNVSAQTSVPTWVRARALSINLLFFQGCMTLGSLTWGAIAQRFGISVALQVAAIGLVLTGLLTRSFRLRCAEKLDLSSSMHWEHPAHSFVPCPQDGPVLITIVYCIDPGDATAFRAAMERLSQIRRRDGAIQWGLFQDLSDPSRFVETSIVESWAEHQRQYVRVTQADRAIEAAAWQFHRGGHPPQITELVYRQCFKSQPPMIAER
jgi:MFS family permease